MSTSIPFLERIFIAQAGGQPMLRVSKVEAIVGLGLAGDRYATGTGYYSKADPCQVTLISGEDLDQMRTLHGMRVHNGEHRRNLVLRGIGLSTLRGRNFTIGAVTFEFDRPRPPCAYVQRLTQAGMTRALGEGAGIAVRVLEGGMLSEGDVITLLPGVAKYRRLP